MEIKKGHTVGTAGPTHNDPPTEEPRACLVAYTADAGNVKRGRLAVHIGVVLKPLMRDIEATRRRQQFRLILGGTFSHDRLR